MPIMNMVGCGGTDTSAVTATANDVLSGKVFVDKDGNEVTGNIKSVNAKTITPSESEQTAVASGVYTTGEVKVAAIPSNYCALNFNVVGGTSAPSRPSANTIWVNTSTTITSYIFSATQPTGSSGMVWISTGTSSTAPFNALKKNGIMVYPMSAKQYVNGAWVTKTAKTYQDGKWVGWTTFLFANGNQFTELTGGWGVNASSGVTCTIGDTLSLKVTGTASREGSVYTKNKINVSNFHTLYVDVNVSTIDYSFRIGLANSAGIKNAEGLGGYVAQTSTTKTGQQTLSLNVENFNSSYYIVIFSDVATASVSNVRLV